MMNFQICSGHYSIIDFYSLFYLRFIKNTNPMNMPNWLTFLDSPVYRAWSGYAFELICLYHLPEVKQALGISGVQTEVSSWRSVSKENGAQVDLVIDRRDQIIHLCEMKFSINTFAIDKKYAEKLRNKISVFKQETGTKKTILLTIVTTYGLKANSYSSLAQNSLTMDVLFPG